MKNPLLAKKNEKECDYVELTPGEIKKLKANGYDPHELKPRGSKDDLFKCKPSGKVVVRRKSQYFDPKKGDWVYAGDDEIEDTGLNINDLPWDIAMKTTQEETLIEFRVTGFSEAPSKVLRDLGIKGAESWQAGDARISNALIKHKKNGFRLLATQETGDFEESVWRLIEKIYPHRTRLAELGADCQLSCVFYLSGSERPVVFFSKEIVSRLAELRGSIDVDIYYLGD